MEEEVGGGWGLGVGGRDKWCIWHPAAIKEASVRIVPSDVEFSYSASLVAASRLSG